MDVQSTMNAPLASKGLTDIINYVYIYTLGGTTTSAQPV